jgi:PTH1 family peptidyl-tRNA hydrolase
MLIFYGLGNNEAKYLHTKHNAGRLVLEDFAKKLGVEFKSNKNFSWLKTSFNSTQEVYLAYSAGYMNHSGQALNDFLQYFKLPTKSKDFHLIILQDDSDQVEGNLKFLPGGGTAGHNGIEDIYGHLKTWGLDKDKIWRLKIGIRPSENRLKSETFVLKNIGQNEKEFYHKIATSVFEEKEFLGEYNFAKFQSRLMMKVKNN